MLALPIVSLFLPALAPSTAAADVQVEIRIAPEARAEPLTGRVFVIFTRDGTRPPIQQVRPTGVPFFGKNVEGLAAGEAAVIDETVFGYPLASLGELPPGDYFVQGFVDVYTRFERADGHTVWLPMDHWEGQNWKRSPGNLFSVPEEVTVAADGDTVIELTCDQVIPDIPFPEDTDMVKRFRFESEILSEWWGHPIQIGATVLLPRGYDEHPEARYPVDYVQDHFSTRAPGGYGRGRSFDEWWMADDTPRFLLVTFQHPTPYYDDSYAVNSANSGPYGDAITQELIPAVEERFHAIGEPWARFLSGGSTGGWEALALQIFHPELFNGAYALCPDAVDFRSHQIVDVYGDDNAYWNDHGWLRVERPCFRQTDGEIVYAMKDENHYELVVGDRSRSGGQWDVWEATYGPVGEDGYPQRIWDKRTGEIDHAVAAYWRKHYDLRHILERDWHVLGLELEGKLHVYVGDMDNYYLNNGVRHLEAFLEQTSEPYYGGEVRYERLAGHCWGPSTQELIEKMTARIRRMAPAGADLESWMY